MNASYKQIGLLRKLGAQIPEGLSMQEASAMIDELQNRPAQPAPRQFTSQVGSMKRNDDKIQRQVAFKGAIEVALAIVPKPATPTVEDFNRYKQMLVDNVSELTEAFNEII